MINFACKDIDMSQIIKCSFGLNKTSYNVLINLLKLKKQVSVEELSKHMRTDRTTVQKAIKVLVEKDLVYRKQKNLENGGYIYLYGSIDRGEVKRRTVEQIDNWDRKAKNAVDTW